jgi:hypothetical protein
VGAVGGDGAGVGLADDVDLHCGQAAGAVAGSRALDGRGVEVAVARVLDGLVVEPGVGARVDDGVVQGAELRGGQDRRAVGTEVDRGEVGLFEGVERGLVEGRGAGEDAVEVIG